MEKTTPSWIKTVGIIGSAPQHHLGGSSATNRLIQMADLKDGQKILVLGCGDGETAIKIAQNYNAEIYATDINPVSIKSNLKQLPKRKILPGSSLLFQVDDLLQSNLPKKYFDRILIESVLIMIIKEKALKVISSLLKPGGLLVLNEGLRLSADLVYLNDVVVEFNKAGFTWYLPTMEEWEGYFRSGGFEIIRSLSPLIGNLTLMGIVTFFKQPFKSVSWALKMLSNSNARAFFKQINKRMKKAQIQWGYGLWCCKKL